MCRMSVLAATAVALSLAAPGAWAKDKGAPKAASDPSATTAPARVRVKAGAEERTVVRRADPLTRATFWTREVEIDPRDPEAALGLAQALRTLGSFDDAAAIMDRYLMANTDDVECLLELARIHIARGQGFYAVAPARRALALAPKDWRAPSLLGVAYEQASRDEEALAAHRQAQALAPNNPSVISNLAMYLAAHGDAAQAESLLRAAAALPGATAQVRQNLALVLGLQGRLAEAEKIAREDRPPELVANNMAYLRAAAGTEPAPQRDWNSLRTQP